MVGLILMAILVGRNIMNNWVLVKDEKAEEVERKPY
jgi:hypothetical protein